MVLNYIEFPERMREIWEWVVAFDAFDYGDRTLLADLVSKGEQIPAEVLPQLSKIISGERKPNLKAAAKLKVPAGERMRIAGSVSAVLGLADVIRARAVEKGPNGWERAFPAVADRHGKELIEEVRYLERESRDCIQDAAAQLGVSVETVENLLRDLRKKAISFPEI